MSERLKKTIALCVFTAWVILFGVCFSEEFGYFHDTPESADQTMEQIFSSPVDRIVYILDELQGAPKTLGFPIVTALILSLVERFTRPIRSIPQYDWPPGRPKLFQFLSTYRI